MPTDDRRTTFGLIFGILGLGIGLGLVIASFIVGVGTTEGTALSTTGTAAIGAFVVLTTILSAASRRRKQSRR